MRNSPQVSRSVNYIKPILVSSILAVAFFVAVATAIIAYWKGCCCSTDDDQNIELALIPHDMLVVALEPTRPPYPGAFVFHHPGLPGNDINSTTSTSTSSYSSSHYANSSSSRNNMSTS